MRPAEIPTPPSLARPQAHLVRARALLQFGVCFAGVVGALALVDQARVENYITVYRSIAVIAAFGLVVLVSSSRFGPWSATSAYAIVFWLFHFGLVASVGIGELSGDAISEWNSRWVTGSNALEAAVLALAGLFAYGVGAAVADVVRHRPAAYPASSAEVNARFERRSARAGAVIVFVSVGLWFVTVIRTGGIAALIGSYGDYLSISEKSSGVMSWIWFFLGMGTVIVLTAQPSRARTFGRMALAMFAPLALPIGLRGEILFPAVTAGVMLSWQGRQIGTKRTILFATATLLLIGIIENVRTVGISNVTATESKATITDALEELGGSLLPVERVVAWHRDGDDLLLGASYVAPFDRAIGRLTPGRVRPPADQDERIMNVLVVRRIGAIGFSPVAEAYRNFGRAGVVSVMLLIGALMATLDSLPRTRYHTLLAAAIFIPMLINVRNDFVSVPAQVALGCLIVVGIRHIGTPAAFPQRR